MAESTVATLPDDHSRTDKRQQIICNEVAEDSALSGMSPIRKGVLLLVFCLAQFLDTFNNGSVFAAIPTIINELQITSGESVWLISAYQLTLAAFLLISGRISDVYSPKGVFIIGALALTGLSIGAGFSQQKVVLLVLRALLGIAAALTIPSALALIIKFYPESKAQARAIGAFGVCGAVGNILGLILGAIIVEYASWRWTFWFVGIAAAPVAIAGLVLIPQRVAAPNTHIKGWRKVGSLDLIGVLMVTAALVLFIFAITSGATFGWRSADVIAPLVISIVLVPCFFYWESRLPYEMAAIPSQTWFYPNFTTLFFISLLPYTWSSIVSIIFTNYWQEDFQWTVLKTVIHLLPIGITTLLALGIISSVLSKHVVKKWSLLIGMALLIISNILLIFPDSPDKYWRFAFTGLVIGSLGMPFAYLHVNVAIFATTPSSMAGTVGAIFNAALQLGSALGVSIVTSIQTNVDMTHTGNSPSQRYFGASVAFEFFLAVLILATVFITIFYRDMPSKPSGEEIDDGAIDFASDIESQRSQPRESNDTLSPSPSVVGDDKVAASEKGDAEDFEKGDTENFEKVAAEDAKSSI